MEDLKQLEHQFQVKNTKKKHFYSVFHPRAVSFFLSQKSDQESAKSLWKA